VCQAEVRDKDATLWTNGERQIAQGLDPIPEMLINWSGKGPRPGFFKPSWRNSNVQ